MLKITRATYIEGYKVSLTFSDGKSGIADLTNVLWGEMFEPLKDVSRFKNFTLSPLFNTICWPNGADIAPESLYEKLIVQTTSHPTRHA